MYGLQSTYADGFSACNEADFGAALIVANQHRGGTTRASVCGLQASQQKTSTEPG